MPSFVPFVVISVAFTAGAVVGGVLLLRRQNLSWYWPLFGLPAAGLLFVAAPVAAAYFAILLLLVSVGAARWHFHEKTAGGAYRERAAARITVGSILRNRRDRRPLENGVLVTDDALYVGIDDSGLPVAMPFDAIEGLHSLVVGSTGSGKTVSQAYIAAQSILQGKGAVVIDPKGDRHMRAVLAAAAARAGKRFIEWSPDGPTTFNPYKHGGPTEVADKALAAETYTEPHYLRQAQRYLGQMIRAMKAAGIERTPSTFVEYMYALNLIKLSDSLDAERAADLRAYTSNLTTRQVDELGGTRDRLAILNESELGRWLNPSPEIPELDLRDVVLAGDVAYVQLDSDRFMLASQMLGVALVCDLITIAANLQRADRIAPTLVLIDEFAAVAADHVSRLFARGRSAGFSVILGTQSLADFVDEQGNDQLVDQVLDNLSSVVIHRQKVPESAERLAEVAGTQETWTTTMRTASVLASFPSGQGTRTLDREFLVHPDAIKSLSRGEAIVLGFGNGSRPATASMFHSSRLFGDLDAEAALPADLALSTDPA